MGQTFRCIYAWKCKFNLQLFYVLLYYRYHFAFALVIVGILYCSYLDILRMLHFSISNIVSMCIYLSCISVFIVLVYNYIVNTSDLVSNFQGQELWLLVVCLSYFGFMSLILLQFLVLFTWTILFPRMTQRLLWWWSLD